MTKSILSLSVEKSHFGNMVSTNMFPQDALLPQVFDFDSGPQVQNNSLKTLTLLDDGMSCSGWYCTFCIAVNSAKQFKRTFGSMACVLNCQPH